VLHLTEISRNFDGDVRFPTFDRAQWREVSRETRTAPPPADFPYAFVSYRRVRPA